MAAFCGRLAATFFAAFREAFTGAFFVAVFLWKLSWGQVPAGPWPPWQLQLSPWPNVCGWPTSAVQRGHEVVELAGNIRRLRLEPETLAGKGDRHRAAFEPRLRRWCVQANGGIMDVCRCQWRRRRSARQCRASLRPARRLSEMGRSQMKRRPADPRYWRYPG